MTFLTALAAQNRAECPLQAFRRRSTSKWWKRNEKQNRNPNLRFYQDRNASSLIFTLKIFKN
jgi:hypothetical protein